MFNLFNVTNVLGFSKNNYSGYANALIRDSQDPASPGYFRSSSFGKAIGTAGGVFGSGGLRAFLVAYFVFVTVAFIAASVAGLCRLPEASEGFRTPLRRLTPAFFVGLSLLLLALLVAGKPTQSLLGIAVVSLGAPIYAALRRGGILGAREAS